MRLSTIVLAVPAAVALSCEPVAAQCVERCTVIHEFTGENGGDTFGWVSDDVGDLDGDQVHDLIITANQYDSGLNNVGRAYVYSGATGLLLFPPITGTLSGEQLGRDVDPAFDVNNDRQADLIVGASQNGPGRAYVFSGSDGSLLRTFTGQSTGDGFGSAVAGLDDIDGDGFADVAIGASGNDGAGSNAGRVYVYSGQNGTLICTADGVAAGNLFGNGVARIGDIDGDGKNDFAVGAQNAGGGPGRAYVFLAADCLAAAGGTVAPHFTLTPPAPASGFGLFFIDGGDMNADGTPDIYVSDFSANRAHVFDGTDGSLLETFTGAGGFGIGRFVGDVTGDGRHDLLLASWIHPGGGTQAGRADLFNGGGLQQILDTWTHDVPFAQFGFDANGMGDVNGDGKTDYLVTAANDSGGTGKAYLIAGNYPRVGDVDGDGFVTIGDFLALLAQWGPCADCEDCPADFDDDCTVGISDFLALLANWG